MMALSPRSDSVVDSLIASQERCLFEENEKEWGSDVVMIPLQKGQDIPRPRKVYERTRSKLQCKIEDIADDVFTLEEETSTGGEDQTEYLYVSQDTLNKLICSANSDPDGSEDVFLSCQEVETQHGKVLMMTTEETEEETICEVETCETQCETQDVKIQQETQEEGDLSTALPSSPSAPLHSEQSADHICSVCETQYKDATTLQHHLASVHADKAMFSCWDCAASFTTAQDYICHKKMKHKDSGNICTICGVLVATQRSLLQHLNSHHATNMFRCGKCGRKYRHACSLQDHIKHKHSSTAPAERLCRECGKEFKHPRSLVRHIKRIHEKMLVRCKTCSKLYSSISSMYHHQRTIHSNVAFHCGYCSEVFRSVSAVKKHENVMHQNVEQYRKSPTEKLYNYEQYVSTKQTGPTIHRITCMFCKAVYKDHVAYSQHCAKFHKDEVHTYSAVGDQHQYL